MEHAHAQLHSDENQTQNRQLEAHAFTPKPRLSLYVRYAYSPFYNTVSYKHIGLGKRPAPVPSEAAPPVPMSRLSDDVNQLSHFQGEMGSSRLSLVVV